MISKELLSEITGVEIVAIVEDAKIMYRMGWCESEGFSYEETYERNDSIIALDVEENRHIFNLHELAHKCKVWAMQYGYSIISYPDFDKDLDSWYATASLESAETKGGDWSQADTEPEAIFKACEWILKENQ